MFDASRCVRYAIGGRRNLPREVLRRVHIICAAGQASQRSRYSASCSVDCNGIRYDLPNSSLRCYKYKWLIPRLRCLTTHERQPKEGDRTSEADEAPSPPTILSYRQQARSPPNIITLTRIASTPILCYCILHDHSSAALAGCFLAGVSDVLDGYLARNFGYSTVLGTYLDPLADKVLVNALSLSLWTQAILPTPLVALWLARDTALMVGSYLYVTARETRCGSDAPKDPSNAGRQTQFPEASPTSSWWRLPRTTIQVKPTQVSKLNTVLQFFTLGAAIASPLYMAASLPLDASVVAAAAADAAPVSLAYAACWDGNWLLQALCWATGATTIASGWDYLRRDAFARPKPPPK